MVISYSIVEEAVDPTCLSLNKKKRNGFNAKEFLVLAQERAKKSLLSTADDEEPATIQDLPYLLQTTRALISTNTAIWDRCQENRSETHDGILPFSRVSIPQLRTHVVDPTTTTFHIPATVTSVDFGAPPPVPRELSDLLVVPIISQPFSNNREIAGVSFTGFPDYAAYLDRATLLRDEALVPFLVKLKEHLESVHVFLGSIEAWLLEPHCHAQFVQDVFFGGEESQVEIPKLQDLMIPCGDQGGDRKCCSVPHPEASLCLKCHKPFREHHRGMGPHGMITHLCDYWSRSVGSFLMTTDYDIRLVQCRPCSSTNAVAEDSGLDKRKRLDTIITDDDDSSSSTTSPTSSDDDDMAGLYEVSND